MSNPAQQIKQMTKKLFKASAGSSHVKTLHPKRDWLIGIGIAVCIVIGITTWNGYTYLENRDGGSTDVEVEIANPRYQAALVEEALGVFATKATDFATIADGAPSLPASPASNPEAAVATSTPTNQPADETVDNQTDDAAPATTTEPSTPNSPTPEDESTAPTLNQ